MASLWIDVADLVLEAGISVDDVPAGHVRWVALNYLLPSRPSRNLTSVEKKASTPKKNKASALAMMITMIAVVTVSLRVGQWTRWIASSAHLPYEFAGGDFGHVMLRFCCFG